jgi:hypothetical protein
MRWTEQIGTELNISTELKALLDTELNSGDKVHFSIGTELNKENAMNKQIGIELKHFSNPNIPRRLNFYRNNLNQ